MSLVVYDTDESDVDLDISTSQGCPATLYCDEDLKESQPRLRMAPGPDPAAGAPLARVGRQQASPATIARWAKEMEVKHAEADFNRSFRFDSKSFFLTYPQVEGHDPQSILDGLLEKHPDIEECWVAEEEHKDGALHYHVWGTFDKKKQLRGADCFDIWGEWALHPNIQSPKDKKKVQKYICKNGKVLMYNNHSFDWSTSHNFTKRWGDEQAWKAALNNNLKEPFIGLLKLGPHRSISINISQKRRHLWIYGPSNSGKTTLVQNATKTFKVWKRARTEYPYEGFFDQDIIWFDEYEPNGADEMDSIEQFYLQHTQVYGKSRYRATFWPLKHYTTVIVTTMHPPTHLYEDWFRNRFFVYKMVENFQIENVF